MTIRVFEINEYDYCAGDCTAQEILDFYMEMTGCSHEDSTGDETVLPVELTPEHMARLLRDTDDTVCSFQDYLDEMIKNNLQFPRYFVGVEV